MDGRQVAAALVLGAQGVVIGTALTVAKESRLPPYKKRAILSAGSQAAAVPGESLCALPCTPPSTVSELCLTCGAWLYSSVVVTAAGRSDACHVARRRDRAVASVRSGWPFRRVAAQRAHRCGWQGH